MEKILTAVDFSDPALNSLAYAGHLARYFSAQLVLVHVYQIQVVGFETGYIPPIIDVESEAKEQMKKIITEFKKDFPDIEVAFEIQRGNAAHAIETAASKLNADLIVMGITGNSGIIKEHIIGSTSSKVAQSSKTPVLIVPDKYKYKKIKNIAFACDYDKHLEVNTTLIKVKYFCSLFNAELKVLNVMNLNEEISEEKAKTDSYVETKFKTTKHNTFFIYDNDVEAGLMEFLNHNEVDILITSPKKHNIFHNIFIESNTKKVIFHSKVPVLTIHE